MKYLIALGIASVVIAALLATQGSHRERHPMIPSTTAISVPPPTTTTTAPAPPAPAPLAVPPPAVPPPSLPAGPATYTVQPGDTLASIGAAHNVDWWALCYNNHLSGCDLIYPGQVLTLDGTPPPTPPPNPAPAPAVQPAPAAQPASHSQPGIQPQPSQQSDCGAVESYIAAHSAPGFTVTCAPNASEGPCASITSHAIGCTVAYGNGGGQIFIDSSECSSAMMTAAKNEASNSKVLSGQSSAPIDPYGPGRC